MRARVTIGFRNIWLAVGLLAGSSSRREAIRDLKTVVHVGFEVAYYGRKIM